MGLTFETSSCGLVTSYSLRRVCCIFILTVLSLVDAQKIALPSFEDLKDNYPGYMHHGGQYRNHELISHIGVKPIKNIILKDTSALRLSYSLNKIGGPHSLGTSMIKLSKFGQDSLAGKNNLQFIYMPIAFGPYLADKYGYPNITRMHQMDPVKTKHIFWGRQGILRVITYSVHGNQPKGHVALWDCTQFYQSKDWIADNNLLTVEFWESPDSNCSKADTTTTNAQNADDMAPVEGGSDSKLLSLVSGGSHAKMDFKYLKKHIVPQHARHSSKKLRQMGMQPNS